MKNLLKSHDQTEPAPEEKPPEVDFMRLMLGLRTELAHSLSGVLLRGSRPVPIGATAGATASASTSAGRLVGWSITETAAAAAKVTLYDGDPANGGTFLLSVPLLANGNDTKSLTHGPGFIRGLFVVTTGTVEGTVWLGDVD